ncbi:MAG TPA: hypothetical protein VFR10_09905 [bacterium]|nr:hypothetical protein [bacterium]
MKKYLSRYAEAEIALAKEIPDRYSTAIVIPVCREEAKILEALLDLGLPDGKVLAVVIVNERAGADSNVARSNATFLAEARRRGARDLGGAGVAFLLHGNSDVVVIDRTAKAALGEREGVGRARKIGCDLAAELFASGKLESRWIHTSDADARIDAHRFRLVQDTARAHESLAAVTLPFRHEGGEEDVVPAISHYEIELRYLVAGLRFAGSPFAFHSIGSTLAISAPAYAGVRGFPNRQAGEDFHILDKLAKTGTIAQPCGDEVILAARHSDRVPFGTGPALHRIAAVLARGEAPQLTAPQCFEALARWLRALDRFADHGSVAVFQSEAGEREADALLGASPALAHLARRNPPGPILRRHLHTWFDGLRTIRFLHCVRDHKYGRKAWSDAICEAAFLRGVHTAHSESALEQMRALERETFLAGLGVRAGIAQRAALDHTKVSAEW